MRFKIYPLLFTAIAALGLSSCNHKELCYVESRIHKLKVVYDWSKSPDATPRGMCVFFYSKDTDGVSYRFDFDNTVGGEIQLPAGHYRLISYNNDTEIVRFSNTSDFESHFAYTRDGNLLEPLYGNGITSNATTSDGQRVCITPDGLWGCHLDEVSIDEQGTVTSYHPYDDSRATGTDASDTQTVTLFPDDLLCHYTFEVRHVENARYISKISAALSGMSGKMKLSDETLDAEKVTLPLSAKVDTDNSKITGQFLTFGHTDDPTVAHKMIFFVVLTDGSKYRIEGADNLDVTSQVDNAPDPRHVHIIIDRLTIPTPDDDEESEWYLTIDDWGIHYEDLPV